VATRPPAIVRASRHTSARGMAASDNNPTPVPPAERVICLSAECLQERLVEEINRAERHGTQLSCLLVRIGNLEELAREHGEELSQETLGYVARTLAAQVRGFDRVGTPSEGELLLILPGADGPRGEIVARRALERLRTIKVEAEGARRPLRISVGLAAWHENLGAGELLEQARLAARRGNGVEPGPGLPGSSPPVLGRPHGPA
jgi:diguanylate cyclase (GGDEF)-like protein